MKDFDLLKSPLKGTNLIEASAGTGKTFTITGIFLRLVLEQALSVDQILVVTFTRDATAELRERIRESLKGLMALIENPGSQGEEFLERLAAEHLGDDSRRKLAYERLNEALRNFDQAAISTIHGFCRRMLQENAFESASAFDIELITDQSELEREVVEDFWRRNFYDLPAEFIQYAREKEKINNPQYFLNLLRSSPHPAQLRIIPQITPQPSRETEKLIGEFRKAFHRSRQAWPEAGEKVRELLINAGLHGSRYGKKIPGLLKGMDDYLAADEPGLPLKLKFVEKFTPDYLRASKTQNGFVPRHPFFDLWEDFTRSVEAVEQAAEQHLLHLKAELFNYVQAELPLRKQRLGVQYFDDLLLKMLDAVNRQNTGGFIRWLQQKYRAVLIDEFQDTDTIQYAVFSQVFGRGNSNLFLIGDPKQAIYSFRGADIFAYRDASLRVTEKFNLGKNWRSEPGLVGAINTIFSQAKHPFFFDWINFHKVGAAREGSTLKLEGKAEPPFQLWFMDAEKLEEKHLTRDGFIKKPDANRLACRATAAQIARLVNLGRDRKAMIGDAPLKPGDIAVLVHKHKNADQIRRSLEEFEIPSLLHERGYLFETHEALEAERVLAAVAEPNNERLLRVALTTDIIGLGGEKLSRALERESDMEHWLVRFGHYCLTWQNHGFMRMFAEFVSRENVRARLLEFADGERRLTNLLHLAEILHQHSIERKPGVRGLVKWLSEQRDPNSPRTGELKLRLATDEDAVKLVTIHSSKGLEYPVVFCPMPWEASTVERHGKTLLFHQDPERFTLDLGSEQWEEHLVYAQNEKLAENLRLFYVALTRARNRCCLVWGKINQSWTSAPAYLFHRAGRGEPFESTKEPAEGAKSLSSKQIRESLEQLASSSGGSIALSPMPLGSGEPYRPRAEEKEKLAFRSFDGRIEQDWKISSFSFLVSGKTQQTDLPDRDAPGAYPAETIREQEEPAGIFAFPRGTKAGNFFHGLLERVDFTESDTEKPGLQVAEGLKLYGFDPGWEKEVCAMLRRLVSLPLGRDGEVFTLSQTGKLDRLNELEFYFPLKPVTPQKLKNIFADYGTGHIADKFPEKIERLGFSPVRGFLKGFMDLVLKHGERFYLVDWKSNYLGSKTEDYRPQTLAPTMQREFYILQYHLYVLALDRYLRLRLPGYAYHNHFGGVYYIFLRGIDPENNPDYGLYHDLPPAGLIEELGKALIFDKPVP